jgi:hypothetical protein
VRRQIEHSGRLAEFAAYSREYTQVLFIQHFRCKTEVFCAVFSAFGWMVEAIRTVSSGKILDNGSDNLV